MTKMESIIEKLSAWVQKPWIMRLCSGFIIFFFLVGFVKHSFGFAGIDTEGRPPIWHGYSVFMSQVGIFAVLSRREVGYWWLLTAFLSEVTLEVCGTWRSVGGPYLSDQLIEVSMDVLGLVCVLATKRRFFTTGEQA